MMLRKTGVALGAIAAGIVLVAGAVSDGMAALTYDITLGAGAQLNDNLHLDPRTAAAASVSGTEGTEGAAGTEAVVVLRQPVKETIYTVNPGITAAWLEGHDRLQLSYGGTYSTYSGDEKRDAEWVHTLAADLNWRRWAPFFLEVQESLSRVPRNQDAVGTAVVDQIDRNLLSVRTGLVSEIGTRSTFELAYRGELLTYSVIGAADPAVQATDSVVTVTNPMAEDFDRVERHFGEVLVRQRWSPLWGSELSLAYGQVDRQLALDYKELRASVVVDQRWSEHLAMQYGVEWRREADDKPATVSATEGAAAAPPADTVRTNLLVSAGIRGALERGGSWNLAYQEGLAEQSDGDTLKTGRASGAVFLRARLGSTLDVGGWYETRDFRVSGREETAWGPTLGARWLITPWAAVDLGGSWTSTTIREAALAEVEDRTTRVAAGLVVLLVKHAQLEAGYGYRKNDSTDALRSYTNNIVYALLTFHFRPVEGGRLPASYASGLIAGGTPSGGTAQVGAGAATAGTVR